MKWHHIMFLPVFGSVDQDLVINLATILIFLLIYVWHLKHDHKHNEEILNELKMIRKKLKK